jgi:uncharacterized membrane protein
VAHPHSHDDERSLNDRLAALASRRVLFGSVVAIAILTVVGMVWLWPGPTQSVLDIEGQDFFGDRVNARVESVEFGECSYSNEDEGGQFFCDNASFVVTSGTAKGERDSIEVPLDGPEATRFDVGDEVILYYNATAPAGARFQFADFERNTPLLALFALFAVVVVIFGRRRGLFAIVGVGISMVVLIGFMLPALLEGQPPIWVALVGTSAVALPVLYLAHGLSERTTVAVLGTVASLLLTCLLGFVFVKLTKLTGLANEEIGFLRAFGGELDFSGLLLAGLVIGALGVLDDVTVTQVAAVTELRQANPASSARELYQAGVRIGRDHIASTVNTLVLAYAGASLPLLLLFRTSGQALAHVVTSEAIAVEVVRALVGSIGLVASVPITTALAALVVTRTDQPL